MATIAGHTQDHDFRCAGHMRNGKRSLFQQFSETRSSIAVDDKSPNHKLKPQIDYPKLNKCIGC